MNINKNLSVKEQVDLLNKKFSTRIKSLDINDYKIINLLNKDNMFIKEINENMFYELKEYFINQKKSLVLNPFFVKNILKKDNFIYRYKDKKFLNIFDKDYLISKKFILKENNDFDINMDTLFFTQFYLNKKTINSFSFLIFIKNFTIYLLKRKNIYYIFILKNEK